MTNVGALHKLKQELKREDSNTNCKFNSRCDQGINQILRQIALYKPTTFSVRRGHLSAKLLKNQALTSLEKACPGQKGRNKSNEKNQESSDQVNLQMFTWKRKECESIHNKLLYGHKLGGLVGQNDKSKLKEQAKIQ